MVADFLQLIFLLLFSHVSLMCAGFLNELKFSLEKKKFDLNAPYLNTVLIDTILNMYY